jgi:hypothetical protein
MHASINKVIADVTTAGGGHGFRPRSRAMIHVKAGKALGTVRVPSANVLLVEDNPRADAPLDHEEDDDVIWFSCSKLIESWMNKQPNLYYIPNVNINLL